MLVTAASQQAHAHIGGAGQGRASSRAQRGSCCCRQAVALRRTAPAACLHHRPGAGTHGARKARPSRCGQQPHLRAATGLRHHRQLHALVPLRPAQQAGELAGRGLPAAAALAAACLLLLLLARRRRQRDEQWVQASAVGGGHRRLPLRLQHLRGCVQSGVIQAVSALHARMATSDCGGMASAVPTRQRTRTAARGSWHPSAQPTCSSVSTRGLPGTTAISFTYRTCSVAATAARTTTAERRGAPRRRLRAAAAAAAGRPPTAALHCCMAGAQLPRVCG